MKLTRSLLGKVEHEIGTEPIIGRQAKATEMGRKR
jgi:hypothetical protein